MVSYLCYGTFHVTEKCGFGAVRKNAVQRLQLAAELDEDFIDTDVSYGPGTAEAVILEALHPYDDVTIATKGSFEHSTTCTWKDNGRAGKPHTRFEGKLNVCSMSRI